MTNEQWDAYCSNLNLLRAFFEKPEVRAVLSTPPTLQPRPNGTINAYVYVITDADPDALTQELAAIVGNCEKKDSLNDSLNRNVSNVSFRLGTGIDFRFSCRLRWGREGLSRIRDERWDAYCSNLILLRTFFEKPEVRAVLPEPPTLQPRSTGRIYAYMYALAEGDTAALTQELAAIVGDCKRDDSPDRNVSGISFRLGPGVSFRFRCTRAEVFRAWVRKSWEDDEDIE